MVKLINQIKSNQAKRVSLFFEESRFGEELKNNLVSIPVTGGEVNENEKRAIAEALLEVIEKIEVDLKLRYPDRHMKFCLWFDKAEMFLRWNVISDIGQKNLPFSSKVEEVTMDQVLANWLTSQHMHDDNQLSFNDIENMSAGELRKRMDSLEVPSLDVCIRTLPSKM